MIALSTLLADHQGGHSDLQMDSFITIRAGGTLYGCYKQALRELAKRCRGLIDLYHRGADAGDTEREFLRFYGQAVALRDALAARGIKFPLSRETRHSLDCEMWEHHIRASAALDWMSCGRLQRNTLELLQSLPIEWRSPLLASIMQQEQTIDWFLSYDHELPEPVPIGGIDIRALIECESLALPELSANGSQAASPSRLAGSSDSA